MIDKNAGTLYTTNTEEIFKLLKILDEMEARTREAIELARQLEKLFGRVAMDIAKETEESMDRRS